MSAVDALEPSPTAAPPPPTTPAPDVANIPKELRNVPRWVTWKYEPREKNGTIKWTKVPYNATCALASPSKADTTAVGTWAEFVTAYFAYVAGRESGIYDGIGLVLNGTDFLEGSEVRVLLGLLT